MFSFQSAFVSFIYLKQPIYYITVFWICQVLFRNFCDFFISSSKAFIVLSNQFLLVSFTLSDDLFIISHIFHFVKYFFRLFFKIFLWLSLSSGDLFIIAYPDAFCQYGNSHNDKLTHHNNFVISVIQILKI